jgi:hypothetical protein
MTKRWDYSDVADQRSKIKNPKSKINMDSRQEHAGMTKRWDYSDVADQRSKIKNPKSKINMDFHRGTRE